MMNLPSIKTLKELIERQRANLDRRGLKKKHYDMLDAVLQNWISGGSKTSAVVFKSDHWNKYDTISFLEGLNFFRVPDGKHYVPEFEAFAALLVLRRRVATKLWREMEQILKRAESLIKSDPERTSIPFTEFVETLSNPVDVVDALTLLHSSGIGLHYNGNQLYPQVQLTEELRRNAKLFLGFVDMKIEQRTRLPSNFPATFPGFSAAESNLDLKRLQLVPDAEAQATKAIDQLLRDPSAAISSAKSSLEATLKWIIDKEGLELSKNSSMPDLLKLCKPVLPSIADPTYFMGRAVANLVTQIAAARNQLGDSHGKGPHAVEPTKSEARFIVVVTLELAAFLLDLWELHKHASQRSVSSIRITRTARK